MGDKTFSEFEIGDTFRSEGRTVTEADIRMFIGATGATHPLHVDHEYAADHPLVDGVAAHGVLSLSIADGFLADFVTRVAALGLVYGHETIRYLSPVYPGDTLTVSAEIVDKTEKSDEWGVLSADVDVSDQDDELVITEVQKFLVARADHPDLD